MQLLAPLPFLALAGPAFAHTGHIAEQAGHSHYLALVALGAALVIAVAAIARSFRRRRNVAPQ